MFYKEMYLSRDWAFQFLKKSMKNFLKSLVFFMDFLKMLYLENTFLFYKKYVNINMETSNV